MYVAKCLQRLAPRWLYCLKGFAFHLLDYATLPCYNSRLDPNFPSQDTTTTRLKLPWGSIALRREDMIDIFLNELF